MRKTTVTLVDDLDGSKADETVEFALEGVQYEIDLTESNAQKLRQGLSDFTSAGRKVRKLTAGRSNGNGRVHIPTSTTAVERQRNTDIREWCRKNGVRCADRGRIAAVVQLAYDTDNPDLAR